MVYFVQLIVLQALGLMSTPQWTIKSACIDHGIYMRSNNQCFGFMVIVPATGLLHYQYYRCGFVNLRAASNGQQVFFL